MKYIKDTVCILLYVLFGLICSAAWFISFALGYILQSTWGCIPCMAAGFAIGRVLAKLLDRNTDDNKKDGGKSDI